MTGWFDLELDIFDSISQALPKPEDYFDFPSSMIAFGESMPGSTLLQIDHEVYFRQRNKQLTLITYFCSSEELIKVLKDLKNLGFYIKGLNYVNKDMSGFKKKKSYKEFFVTKGYSPVDYAITLRSQDNDRRNILRSIKNGEENYVVEPELNKVEAFKLFNDCLEEAKSRHFMVVRGHYERYLNRYFSNPNNVRMMGFRRKKDGLLYGITGYEYFRNQAQATLGKHRIGDGHFARFYIMKLVEIIFKERPQVEKIFLGSTADPLKISINLQWKDSYKIDFDSITG